MNASLAFKENEATIFAVPLDQGPANGHTHQGVSALPDANKPPEVTAKQVTPAVVYDRAADVGQVLQTKVDAPKGDMNYACTTLGNMMKDTVTGLFGALKSKEPEMMVDDPEVAMAPPPLPKQQPVFGL